MTHDGNAIQYKRMQDNARSRPDKTRQIKARQASQDTPSQDTTRRGNTNTTRNKAIQSHNKPITRRGKARHDET